MNNLKDRKHEYPGLIWFRADLRVVDNKALAEACLRCSKVFALFISTPTQWHQHHVAPMQIDLIRRRLELLRLQLANLNIPLVVAEIPDFGAGDQYRPALQ